MQKILFFHGGPGLNSNPERHLLTERYREAGFELLCWDEPSRQRPEGHLFSQDNAFGNYLDSAESFLLQHYTGEPVTVLGYCFGSHPAVHLLKEHSGKIGQLVIITPDFQLPCSDRNILTHVMNDYWQHQDERWRELQEILSATSATFGEKIARGWQLAAVNPRLFNYYWQDMQKMQEFVQYYNNEYVPDAESFFSVRRSWYAVSMTPSTEVPVIVIYGKHDNIISVEEELAVLPRYFVDPKIIEMPGSGHYPHIEEPEKVLQILQEELKVHNHQSQN